MRLVWLVFLVVLANVNAGHVWLKDLFSPKGVDLGCGVVLKLHQKNGENVPIMERFTLDLKLGNSLGVSVGKPKSDGVELDFYVNKDGNFHEGESSIILLQSSLKLAFGTSEINIYWSTPLNF